MTEWQSPRRQLQHNKMGSYTSGGDKISLEFPNNQNFKIMETQIVEIDLLWWIRNKLKRR